MPVARMAGSQSSESLAPDRWRPALWAAVFLLSAAILAFPVRLRYEYYAIQSAHAFGPLLSRFAVLYCAWVGVLLLLLFTGCPTEWERLVLVCLFALVYFGAWTLSTPEGEQVDAISQLGHVRYLLRTGRMTLDYPNLGYFIYPSFHLINAMLSLVCGLGSPETRVVFLLLIGMLTAMLLYLWFARVLQDPVLSSLAVLLMVHGAYGERLQSFWPGNLAFAFLVFILALLLPHPARTGSTATGPARIVLVPLIVVFVASYLPTPVYLLFMLVGVYIVQRISKRDVINPSIMALFVVIFAAWQLYRNPGVSSWTAFGLGAEAISTLSESIFHPVATVLRLFSMTQVYIGEGTPAWARLTRIFWYALLFGVGGALWIWNLIRARSLDARAAFVTGGLLGVSLFSLISIFIFPPWRGLQWARVLPIGALFLVAMLLGPVCRLGVQDRARAWVQTTAALLIFVFSFPAFLIAKPHLFVGAVYPYETAAGQFLVAAYGDEPRDFYSFWSVDILYSGYLPALRFPILWSGDATSPPGELALELTKDAGELWRGLGHLVTAFEQSHDARAILVVSERLRAPPGLPTHIGKADPRWIALLGQLGKNNETYCNGHLEVYQLAF